jgi:hypothetical protein
MMGIYPRSCYEKTRIFRENFRGLERQANYSAALGAELQALISYKKSIIAFQKSEYALLETNGFVTAAGNSGNLPRLP